MEASFVNFAQPGLPVVVGVNGLFGERMCEVADRLGADVVRVDAAWGESIDPGRLLSAHPSPSIIAVVHAETSTGVRNDIEPPDVGGLAGKVVGSPTTGDALGYELPACNWGLAPAYLDSAGLGAPRFRDRVRR